MLDCENQQKDNFANNGQIINKFDTDTSWYSFPYVISKEKSTVDKKRLKFGLPPFPLKHITKNDFGFGFAYQNLIFWKSSIYFYKLEHLSMRCLPFDSTQFDQFLNLAKNDFVRLPKDGIIDFIKLNTKDTTRQILVIASLSDTITNTVFNSLVKSIDRILVRKISEEEYNVINAIEKDIYYNKEDYKWETIDFSYPIYKRKNVYKK